MNDHHTYPDILDLVAFFECEPILADSQDPPEPWYLNNLAFRTRRGEIEISAVLGLALGILDISIEIGGNEIAAAQVRALGAVQIEQDGGRETLTATFGQSRESTLWLTLRPYVRLGVEGRDGVIP